MNFLCELGTLFWLRQGADDHYVWPTVTTQNQGGSVPIFDQSFLEGQRWGVPLATCTAEMSKDRPTPVDRIYLASEGGWAHDYIPTLILRRDRASKASDGDNLIKSFQDSLCEKYGFNDRGIYHSDVEKVIVPKSEEYAVFEIIPVS